MRLSLRFIIPLVLALAAIAQLSWRGWVEGVRALLRGEGLLLPKANKSFGVRRLCRFLAGEPDGAERRETLSRLWK